MLEKFVEAVMMNDFYHNRHLSILEKYAQEKMNTLMKWVEETYAELSDVDRISGMIFDVIEAHEKCMLTKGLVIGLLLGIDCLTDNPYKNDHSS